MREVEVSLIVIAKAPVPGRVKTRLCPPCSPAEAAVLAQAALADTLAAGSLAPVGRRVLALDGEPGAWLPAGWEVVSQRGAGLDQRLAAAFEDVGGPALLVGMDTPQLTGRLLSMAAATLRLPETDAVIGPTLDGGYWGIGLGAACPQALVGVPMSRDDTCRHQLAALRRLGLRVATLPVLRDVDTFADAEAVAAATPASQFADAMAGLPARAAAA